MKTYRLSLVFVAALAFPLAVDAQPAAKSATPVRATVGDVTDNRTTGSFNAECKVELKFTGDAAADASSIRQVHVSKAVDETGRDLVPADDSDSFHAGFLSSRSARSGGSSCS